MRSPACHWSLPLLTALILTAFSSSSYSQKNCDTVFSRVARVALQNAVAAKRDNACTGLKEGAISVDKTKRLELTRIEVCEDAAIVSAAVDLAIKCGTSDAAVLKVNLEDTIHAAITADLNSCSITNSQVSAGTFLATLGIEVANLSAKLKEAAATQIKPYCRSP